MQTKMARKDEKCNQKLILDIQNGRRPPFWEKKWKLRFDLKWREMQTKINFGHPKWPPAAIFWKKMKLVFSSELTRNTNEKEFRTSKMSFLSEMSKNANKKLISDIQNGCRQPFWAKKMKIAFWSEMVRNANENEFQTSKMATGGHFENIILKVSFLYNIQGRGTSYIRQYLVIYFCFDRQ